MSRPHGRLSALIKPVAICLLVGGLVVADTCPVLAAPQSSGGNVIITAVIAPVRYILVDDNYRVQEIISNSRTDVTPVVYKDRLNTAPISLTPAIASQYAAIMAHVNASHPGVIYRFKQDMAKKQTGLFARTNLGWQLFPKPPHMIFN